MASRWRNPVVPEQQMNLTQLPLNHWDCGIGYLVSAQEVLQSTFAQLIPLVGIDQACAHLTRCPGSNRGFRFSGENWAILPLKVPARIKFGNRVGGAKIAMITANRNDMKNAQLSAPYLRSARKTLRVDLVLLGKRERKDLSTIPTIVYK